MIRYRTILPWLVLLSSIALCGFKKPVKKTQRHRPEAKTAKVETAKPLDLAVPGKAVLGGDAVVDVGKEKNDASLFEASEVKHQKPVGLRGQVILSQEPEAGKLRSADGAGIVFDFRH